MREISGWIQVWLLPTEPPLPLFRLGRTFRWHLENSIAIAIASRRRPALDGWPDQPPLRRLRRVPWSPDAKALLMPSSGRDLAVSNLVRRRDLPRLKA